MIHYRETLVGFEWGAATVNRLCDDKKKGWIIIGVETPKTRIQIYVTKTGKLRVLSHDGEWRPQP